MDDHRVGQDFVGLGANLADRLRRQLDLVFVLLRCVLLLFAQLLDHREIHHLVERHRRILDCADLAVEIVGLPPDSLEVRGIVLVEEELVVLGPVRVVGVAEHVHGVVCGNVVAVGHQLGAVLLAVGFFISSMASKMPRTRPSMMPGWSLAKSARANHTSAISLLAVCVVTNMRLPLALARL